MPNPVTENMLRHSIRRRRNAAPPTKAQGLTEHHPKEGRDSIITPNGRGGTPHHSDGDGNGSTPKEGGGRQHHKKKTWREAAPPTRRRGRKHNGDGKGSHHHHWSKGNHHQHPMKVLCSLSPCGWCSFSHLLLGGAAFLHLSLDWCCGLPSPLRW